MDEQKDRHLEAPGEANRDKHINFLAAENGEADPSSENFDDDKNDSDKKSDVDNGFFTDDDNRLQSKNEHEEDKSNKPAKKAKVVPFDPDVKTPTIGDKISVNTNNDDILSVVKDDDQNPYLNEKDQPR